MSDMPYTICIKFFFLLHFFPTSMMEMCSDLRHRNSKTESKWVSVRDEWFSLQVETDSIHWIQARKKNYKKKSIHRSEHIEISILWNNVFHSHSVLIARLIFFPFCCFNSFCHYWKPYFRIHKHFWILLFLLK